MESVIDQTLRDIHGANALFCLELIAENNFMHCRSFVGKVENSFEALADVIGIQHRIFSRLPQTVWTIGHDVSEGADEHSEISIKGANSSDRIRPVVIEP